VLDRVSDFAIEVFCVVPIRADLLVTGSCLKRRIVRSLLLLLLENRVRITNRTARLEAAETSRYKAKV
jgi:hypothetical protein